MRSLGSIVALLSCLAAAPACQGLVSEPDSPLTAERPPDEEVVLPSCEGICTGPASMGHLSRRELQASIESIFGVAAESLPFDSLPNVPDGRPDYTDTRTIRLFAEEAAAELALSYRVGCGTDRTCVEEFVADFVRRFYRRPPTAEEVQAYQSLYDSDPDAVVGKRLLFTALLQSPHFRYQVRIGTPSSDGAFKLTDYEMASRLSFLFWDAPPDQELLNAAAQGRLGTPEEVGRAARRLLMDPRSDSLLAKHYLDLVHAESLHLKLPDADPALSGIGALMQEETSRFVAHVMRHDDGTLSRLLTAPYTIANGRLREHYGLGGGESEFARVDLDGERAGLLTQGTALIGGGIDSWDSTPIHRGNTVFSQFLCQSLGIPEDVTPIVPDWDQSLRNRVTEMTACGISCHSLFNPIGFAFGSFDHRAQLIMAERFTHRFPDGSTVDRTFPVDTRVEFTAGPLQGTYDGPVELVQAMAESADVQSCHSRRWMERALGRSLHSRERAVVEDLDDTLGSGHLFDLLVAITQSESFRYRIVPEEQDWREDDE